MKVSFAVPYRETDVRRQSLHRYVTEWLEKQHPTWPIHTGASPDGPFNRGAAINNAVRQADPDWDVIIVHDADNICDPDALEGAVQIAHTTGKVCFPFETYIYLDEFTSNRLIRRDNWFIAPELHPHQVFKTTVRHKHYSGIQVISRKAYEAVGGYIELTGWGAEDAIMNTVFETFSPGVTWLRGGAYHLWHPANRNDPRDVNNVRNHQIWTKVQAAVKLRNPKDALRQYLSTVGYRVPAETSCRP